MIEKLKNNHVKTAAKRERNRKFRKQNLLKQKPFSWINFVFQKNS